MHCKFQNQTLERGKLVNYGKGRPNGGEELERNGLPSSVLELLSKELCNETHSQKEHPVPIGRSRRIGFGT